MLDDIPFEFDSEKIKDCFGKTCETCEDKFSDKNCKCFQQLIDDAMNYDDVFCAHEEDGYLYACNEGCCNNGAGCIEPVRCSGEDYYEGTVPNGCNVGIEFQDEQPTSIKDYLSENTLKDPKIKRMSIADWIIIIIVAIVIGTGLVFAFRRR